MVLVGVEVVVIKTNILGNLLPSARAAGFLLVTCAATLIVVSALVVIQHCPQNVVWLVSSGATGALLGILPLVLLLILGPSIVVDILLLPGEKSLELLGSDYFFGSSHLGMVDRLLIFNKVLWANASIFGAVAVAVSTSLCFSLRVFRDP